MSDRIHRNSREVLGTPLKVVEHGGMLQTMVEYLRMWENIVTHCEVLVTGGSQAKQSQPRAQAIPEGHPASGWKARSGHRGVGAGRVACTCRGPRAHDRERQP